MVNFTQKTIQTAVNQHLMLINAIASDTPLQQKIAQAIERMVAAYKAGNKVLFCGNGGSAADAQHLAAELSGRFLLNRAPLFAEALHVNTSYLTAVANDFGYDAVFARAVEAKGKAGDVLVALSTSGNSTNIINAARVAQKLGIAVVALTGATGGALAAHCDLLISAPSQATPRIQEAHILIGHIICEAVEYQLFMSNE